MPSPTWTVWKYVWLPFIDYSSDYTLAPPKLGDFGNCASRPQVCQKTRSSNIIVKFADDGAV